MRLRLVREALDDDDFIFELKHDGFRGVVYVEEQQCRLASRNQRSLKFASLKTSLAKLPVDNVILDGEIIARWYTVAADGSYLNTPYEDLSYKWAGGGFLSTAEDLVRFGSALLNAGFLKQDTLKMLFSPQKMTSGQETKYGFGWFIHDAEGPEKERQFEHSGGVAGSSAWLVIYPDRRVVIAWLQNSNDFRDWPVLQVASPFFAARK